MPVFSRKRIFIGFIFLSLLLGAWLYFQRFTRVALATYVPDSALGYVEVNDLPGLLQQFAGTDAWRELAPLYGLQNALQYAGWANWWGRWAGIGTKESLLMARGQFVLVVSGIEVRGEEVKPRWALLMETHRSASSVKALMAAQLPTLAQRALQNPVQETSEYAGTPITIFRTPNTDRQLLSASFGSTWLIANDAPTLQSCLDVRLGRVASVAQNPKLVEAKTEVASDGAVFAFVSNAGAARLSQFFTHLLIGKSLAGTPLAGMPEGVMAEISENTVEAMAYSTSFANGGVLERYAVLCKPEVAQSLQTTLRVPENAKPEQSEALKLVPATAQEVTLVRIADPGQALDGVERIVSGHLGVAQSFLFHRFFTSARKMFLGLEPGENPSGAIGSEVVQFSLDAADSEALERVWLVAARNRQQLAQLAERLLRQQDANVGRLKLPGGELTSTSNGKRAFAWLGNYLVLGSPENVMRLAEERGKAEALLNTPAFIAAPRPVPTEKSMLYSFHSVAVDTQTMMRALARRLRGNPQADAAIVLERLPWATTVTSLTERGVTRESRSPVGSLPLLVTFADRVF